MKIISELSVVSEKKIPNYIYPLYAVSEAEDIVIPDELNAVLKAIVENEFYVHTSIVIPELKTRSWGLFISDWGIFNMLKRDRYDFYRIILRDGIPYLGAEPLIITDDKGEFNLTTHSLLKGSNLDPESLNAELCLLNRYLYEMTEKKTFNIKAFIVFPRSLEREGFYF